jgi:hypothetical protein
MRAGKKECPAWEGAHLQSGTVPFDCFQRNEILSGSDGSFLPYAERPDSRKGHILLLQYA